MELTISDLKELMNTHSSKPSTLVQTEQFIGSKVIVRTYSAGAWFGTLRTKSGNEVILCNARRMYKWWAAESISLSAVSIHGIKHDKSKICEPVRLVWLEAIEITPCEDKAITSIESAPNAKAE